MMRLERYPFQCVRCRFGGAKTGSFSPHSHAQITLKLCMHLRLSLYTLSIYIRKHCAQFLWCEDRKTGWCTKAHTNYFANGNNIVKRRCDECEQQGAMNANDRNRDQVRTAANGNLYSPHGGNRLAASCAAYGK